MKDCDKIVINRQGVQIEATRSMFTSLQTRVLYHYLYTYIYKCGCGCVFDNSCMMDISVKFESLTLADHTRNDNSQ